MLGLAGGVGWKVGATLQLRSSREVGRDFGRSSAGVRTTSCSKRSGEGRRHAGSRTTKSAASPQLCTRWPQRAVEGFARRCVAELTTTILPEDEVRDLVERMLRTSGRRVELSPFVDETLTDGFTAPVKESPRFRRTSVIKSD
jgi:hypothetical protein